MTEQTAYEFNALEKKWRAYWQQNHTMKKRKLALALHVTWYTMNIFVQLFPRFCQYS